MKKGKLKIALFSGWAIIAVLNVLDVWSTNSLLNTYKGIAEEANPVMAWFMDHSLFIPVKIILVLSVGVMCFRTKNPKRLATMIWLVVPIYVYTVAHNISYM